MILAHIAQYVHGLHAVTVIVNQQQVRTARGEVRILDTLAATELGDHFSLLALAQCIIDMHHDFDLMKVAPTMRSMNRSVAVAIERQPVNRATSAPWTQRPATPKAPIAMMVQ